MRAVLTEFFPSFTREGAPVSGMGVTVRRNCEAQSSITGASMATYDEMSPAARQQLMQALGSLSGLREGPKGTFPDGTHYEYDPDLKGTVEVTSSGDRFPVALVRGELKRDSANVVARKGEAA